MARKKKSRTSIKTRKKSKRTVAARNGRNKKKPAKKKKRDLTSLPGLKKNLFSRIKQEYHDLDYLDKLSDKDKLWLSKFMEEDLGARFNHSGSKVYRKKRDKIESYRRNNQRNRDLYSLLKATGKFNDTFTEGFLTDLLEEETLSPEDALIDYIDSKSEKLVKKS